jgi:hypothetical protein
MCLRIAAALGLALALAFAPASPAVAQDTYAGSGQRQESTWGQAGLGLLAIGTNILYAPAKMIYGGLGLGTGSAGWILTGGDREVASRVFTPSLRGTYVLTPRHLTGDDPIHFVGSSNYNATGPVTPRATAQSEGTLVAEEEF